MRREFNIQSRSEVGMQAHPTSNVQRSLFVMLWVSLVMMAPLRDTLAEDTPETACVRAVPRIMWFAPNRVDWRLINGPFWSSMGHTSRVMCIIPVGTKEQDGRIIQTHDGSGFVYAVRIEVHQVDAFISGSAFPEKTTCLKTLTIDAGNDEALKRRNNWGFPHEQVMDFEFERVPPLEHQTLTRIFLHDDPHFWYTLMIHAEADVEPTPPEIQQQKPKITRYFKEIFSHTVVCELLHDPTLSMTSTYIEADDPPSTTWIENEQVKAPWAYGEGPMKPGTGSLTVGDDGSLVFGAMNEDMLRAVEKLEAEQAEAATAWMPKLSESDVFRTGEFDIDFPSMDAFQDNEGER